MSVNLNMDKKLRVGGRKAPQMSIEDFTALLKSWLLKGHCDDDDLDQRLYLTLNEGQRDEKFFRDILKIEVDFSNVELEDIMMGTNGVPFAWVKCSADDAYWVWAMVYWDGKHMRGYVPTYGNTFDASRKAAYQPNEDGPINLKYWEYGKEKKQTFDDEWSLYDWLALDAEAEANVDACVEDFSSQVTPTTKVIPEEVQRVKEKFAKDRDKANEDS